MTKHVDELVRVLRAEFSEWKSPGGWPNEADSALIDTVFSTRARYEDVVVPLVNRWRNSSRNPKSGRLSAILSVDSEAFRELIGNKQRMPGRGILTPKWQGVRIVAESLISQGWDSAEEIRLAATNQPEDFRQEFVKTPGVGRAQYAYFLMLLGMPGVKADTLVTAWVERALGGVRLSQEEVEAIVTAAALELNRSPTDVDHAIWRRESFARAAKRRKAR